MTKNLSIVMYHYVRELKKSRFPAIKGLEVDDFRRQLDYLAKHYQFVTIEDCIEAMSSDQGLPKNSLLLTFDDGYIDHFTQVFPIMDERKIQGSFFPPGRAITERRVLDVNKIHYILASVASIATLLEEVYSLLGRFRSEHALPSNEELFAKLAIESRYDAKEVIFIKRLLQKELSVGLRAQIVDILFQKFVSKDETAFANELYMSLDQVKCLVRNGMYVGSHGWEHFWLNSLSESEQRSEIRKSLEFLKSVGAPTEDWVMCFPYGGYDDSTLRILSESRCRFGFTTRVGIADLSPGNALTLERLDTNDFPKDPFGAPVSFAAR